MDANKKNGNGRATPGGSYFVPLTDGEPAMAYPVTKPAYGTTTTTTTNANPYVQMTPAAGSGSMSYPVMKVLGRCGRMLEDGTRKAVGITGNVWHHITTSPSPCDAAMTRLAQGTRLLAEGGHDKIFHHRFGVLPGEKLRKAYACYLSTTSGPVIGTLYVSTTRLAFCSDNPLCLNSAVATPEWVYYKVVVQLDKLRSVNPSSNKKNPSERYIQTVTKDDHEFWFLGFVSYEKALHTLLEAVHHWHPSH